MKVLKCYPFKLVDPVVRLVEGFKAYDGVLGDEPGKPHRGIDYARIDEKGKCLSFEVFNTHDGEVFQGRSKSWGRFVIIYKLVRKYQRFATVYAHLRDIDKKIPLLPKRGTRATETFTIGKEVICSLGKAGASGDTKGNIQLHFELQIKNLKTNERQIIDPYGVYDRYTSGKYPQPGESLRGHKHYWTSNKPPFADDI